MTTNGEAATKRVATVPVSFLGKRPARGNAAGEIIESLRATIASGDVLPGARLPAEDELARHFEVSPPTVREALRALEAMGLLETRHGSGRYVTGDPQPFVAASLQTLLQMKSVTLLDVLDLRHALAGHLARRIVRNASDEDLEELADLAAQLRQAATSAAQYEQVAEVAIIFHTTLSASAHDPLLFAIDSFLAELLVRLSVKGFKNRPKKVWRKWTVELGTERERLLEQLRARDADGAAAAAEAYIDKQRHWFSSDPRVSSATLSDPGIFSESTRASG